MGLELGQSPLERKYGSSSVSEVIDGLRLPGDHRLPEEQAGWCVFKGRPRDEDGRLLAHNPFSDSTKYPRRLRQGGREDRSARARRPRTVALALARFAEALEIVWKRNPERSFEPESYAPLFKKQIRDKA